MEMTVTARWMDPLSLFPSKKPLVWVPRPIQLMSREIQLIESSPVVEMVQGFRYGKINHIFDILYN